jgi:hypothetical protein
MNALTYALVTPSFRLDLQRCELLVESVQARLASHVRHYIVVDRRDVPLFKHFESDRTRILIVEDIVPWWIFRAPGLRRFWISLRTRPLKNWILQQIVKLSIPGVVSEDVLLYADSDVFFIAPFDPRSLERAGKVPLFVETGQRGLIRSNDHWHGVAAKLLGIPQDPDGYDTNYIGNVITWRRQNALALTRRLEEVAGKAWPLTLAPLNAFSEYVLYGMFAQRVLGESSQQWDDPQLRTLNYWLTQSLSYDELAQFRATSEPHHHSVMISAKSRTPVPEIRKAFLA